MKTSIAKTVMTSPIRLLPLFVIASLLLVFSASCSKEQKASGPAPPEVEVIDVVQKDVPIQSEWIGTIDGMVNAVIKAQVSGYLIKQNYKEGTLVKKDDVLFEIDPRPFQAAFDQAKAELAQQQARLDTAKANLARIRPLARKNAVSQKDLDDAVGAEQSLQAGVLGARAAVEKATLDLEFTKIKSPIDGIAGLAAAQIGNLVGPQTADLTTVSTVDPVKVYVSVSEQEYMRFVQAAPRTEPLALDLILADGSLFPQKGKVAFADRQVDVKTGSIRVATEFPNPGNLLRPGQYAKVRASVKTRTGALLVPQRAVADNQGSYQLAVVGKDNKVSLRAVKVSERIGSQWIISEGLQPGDRVIVEGIQKVKDGMTVVPKPASESPAPEQAPVSSPDKR